MQTLDFESEEWFTLDDITLMSSVQNDDSSQEEVDDYNTSFPDAENNNTLYCISVDSEEKQFLITENGIPTHNTEEGKAEDELKGEATMILGSIARLGRAAGVHLVLATQRPDATILPGETKANLGARVCCGTVDATASSMILGNGEGARISPNPGRIYVKIFSRGNHAQGFFAPPSWLDEYFESQGLHPDGTKKVKEPSRMQKLAELEALEQSGDLDAKEGNRNHGIIADMRDAESRGEEYVPEDDETKKIYENLLSRFSESTNTEVDGEDGEDGEDDDGVDRELNEDIDNILDAVDDEKEEDHAPVIPQEDRPELGAASSKSKTYRHEDDWDSFMDTIQELNEPNEESS